MEFRVLNSIISGVLSPANLSDDCIHNNRFRQDARRLRRYSYAFTEMQNLLSTVLQEWGEAPPDYPDLSVTPDLQSRPDDMMNYIHHLRMEEFDHVLTSPDCLQLSSPLFDFYDALLALEFHTLNLHIAEMLLRLRSRTDARTLIIGVLDDIYVMAAKLYENGCCHLSPSLCRHLRGTLACFYLELSGRYCDLLESEDYCDYHQLLADPLFDFPFSETEKRKYEILCLNAKVRHLLVSWSMSVRDKSEDGTPKYKELGRAYYASLCGLLEGLADSRQQSPVSWKELPAVLWQGVLALENFLYCLYSKQSTDKFLSYVLVTDSGWMATQISHFYSWEFDKEKVFDEARSICHDIRLRLMEECFTFFDTRLPALNSLPRRIYLYLQQQLNLYENNYDGRFVVIRVVRDEDIPDMPVTVADGPDMEAIRKIFDFLTNARSKHGYRIMQANEVDFLRRQFLCFVSNKGIPQVKQEQRVRVTDGTMGVVLGLFFHYCAIYKQDKEKYARFLYEHIANDCKNWKVFRNNAAHYRKAYTAFLAS
ncbi:MAG: hypothetical protein IJ511_00590 [Bacteroides sp.]|nr:hypothetical protein [Bacteroides sp.]